MTRHVSELVAEARRQIREVEPRAVQDIADAVLIDVREPHEFAGGHIPGAVNIPRGVLEFQIEAHPAVACATDPVLAVRDRPIVLYCLSGGRAALAAQALQTLGFSRVHSITGGISAWAQGGLPVLGR